MKKIILIYILLTLIQLLKAQEISIPYSTDQNNLTIWNGEEYVPFFVKGVNLGVAIPGTFPGELAASEEQYLNWFSKIKEAGFNCIRIYTLHYPRFYNALKNYNESNPINPLLFFQGVWLNEDISGYQGDLYFMKDTFLLEIQDNVDCVHGNNSIEARFGKAFGVYNADVSDYCLGYIIGREVIPAEIDSTNKNNSISGFTGNHFSIQGGTASEVLVTEALDHLVHYENTNYNTQRPVSFSSWPTLDPLTHDEELNPEEDSEQLDFSKINIESAPAGVFVSYHAYPYYPDFVSEQTSYNEYYDNLGPNSYIGYLTELKSHYPDFPLIIAEYGVPSSWATAHFASSGMNHGGFSEMEQGNNNIRMLQNMYDLNIGGGIQFSWMDEWFKRTWITDKVDFNAEDRILWNNLASAEQNFGLVKFIKPETTSSLANFGINDSILNIEAATNYSYLKINIGLNQSLEILDEMWIALDTYDATLGESILPNGVTIPDYRSEFSIYLTKYTAQLYVTEAYDLFGNWHGVSEPEQLYHSIATDGAPWNLVRLKNNFPYNDVQYIGNLNVKNSNQPVVSTDAVIIYDDSLVIKLPWSYINFIAPNKLEVMHDNRATSETETQISDGIAVAVNYKNKWFKSDSRFVWNTWNATDLAGMNEELKGSYWVIKDRLSDFNTEAIAYRDTFQFINETYPVFVDDLNGVLKNDFDLDGTDLMSLIIDPLQHGNIELYYDGSFNYTPDSGFNGYDSISYVLYDGYSLSEEVTAVFYVEQNTTDIENTVADSQDDVTISPNPCNEYLHINSGNMMYEIKIFDAEGVLKQNTVSNHKDLTLDVSGLSNGIYYLIISFENKTLPKKFIKQ